jgi:hypothetical protein
VKLFMDIEYPEGGPIAAFAAETFPTIGEFYDALEAAFVTLAPPMSVDRQITTFWMQSLSTYATVRDAWDAIALIKVQGEGSKASPEEADNDLAHYYRFGEIYYGKKLRKDPNTGRWVFNGQPVAFPDAWPVARVPAGGYLQAQVSAEVWALLDQFDSDFSAFMRTLHEAWTVASSDRLDDAINAMSGLTDTAVQLVQIVIPSSTQTYAPCFRFKP